MKSFITLSCPSCGGQLKITDDIERFGCIYCGMEHIVKRGDGIISLAPVIEKIDKVMQATTEIKIDLETQKLKEEIKGLNKYIVERNKYFDEKNLKDVQGSFGVAFIVLLLHGFITKGGHLGASIAFAAATFILISAASLRANIKQRKEVIGAAEKDVKDIKSQIS